MAQLFSSPSPDRESDGPKSSRPLTVSQTAELLRTILAAGIPGKIAVVGEVSNFSNRSHWFFSLKDVGATLRCVCFASNARRCQLAMENGLQVIATGRLDYYDQQGQLQLYVETVEPVGRGSLEQQLKALVEELRQAGYLDLERKKPLPAMPCRVAVVTSRTGAALQDVINTAQRRWGGCELLLVDVMVQGAGAAPGIARALRYLARRGQGMGIDGIILTRGGGSIEDLWAFNDRAVAEAIFRCSIPIVAAIGHETDTTVAELVADVRCATPTQAAMTLIPDRWALLHQVQQTERRLAMVLHRRLDQAESRLLGAARAPFFRRPELIVRPLAERIARAEGRLGPLLRRRLEQAQGVLTALDRRVAPALTRRLDLDRTALQTLERQLEPTVSRRVAETTRRLDALARQLDAVGPRSVLKRGYTYTLGPNGQLVRAALDVRPGDHLTTVTASGQVQSTVDGEEQTPRPNSSATRRIRRRKVRPADDEPSLFGS